MGRSPNSTRKRPISIIALVRLACSFGLRVSEPGWSELFFEGWVFQAGHRVRNRFGFLVEFLGDEVDPLLGVAFVHLDVFLENSQELLHQIGVLVGEFLAGDVAVPDVVAVLLRSFVAKSWCPPLSSIWWEKGPQTNAASMSPRDHAADISAGAITELGLADRHIITLKCGQKCIMSRGTRRVGDAFPFQSGYVGDGIFSD